MSATVAVSQPWPRSELHHNYRLNLGIDVINLSLARLSAGGKYHFRRGVPGRQCGGTERR